MQGFPEPAGKAKITPAYNLPSKFVIHTVGPVVSNKLTQKDCSLLKSCYVSCLNAAIENNLESIAFCCISTGEFHFPNEEAAHIAVQSVKEFKEKTSSKIKVIFNVFKDIDLKIYKEGAVSPSEIKDRSILLNNDIKEVLEKLSIVK